MAENAAPELKMLPPHEEEERRAEAGLAAVSVRHVIAATVIVVALASVFRLFFIFSRPIFYIFIALVLGTALRPVADWIAARTGLSRRHAAALVYGLVIVVLAAVLVFGIPALAEQAGGFAARFPSYVDSARRSLLSSSSGVIQRVGRELPNLLEKESAGSMPAFSASDLLGYLGALQHVALMAAAILLVGFYWLVEGEATIRTLLHPLGPARRESARELIEEAEARVGGFVRGQLMVCAASVVLSTAGYLLMGLPSAVALGVFFGACGAIPVFGAPLGALPAILVAFSSGGPALVVWVIANAAVVHVIQDYVLAPRIMGKHAGVSAFTILLAISAFGGLLGVAGALLAIPMAAILQMFFDRYVVAASEELPAPSSRDRFAVLQLKAKELAVDVKKQVRDREVTERVAKLADEVEAIAGDIERALARSTGHAEPAS